VLGFEGSERLSGQAETELGNDPIAILKSVSANIETARKTLQEFNEQLVLTNENAKEIARNELCRGLIERLQLAEREAAELADLIVIARKP
jgi:predicted DNA-binding protein YlxM (UPF0122 family)